MKTTAYQALYRFYEFIFFTFILGSLCVFGFIITDLIKDDLAITYSLEKVEEKNFIPADSVIQFPVKSNNSSVVDANVKPDGWDITFTTTDNGIQYFMAMRIVLTIVYLFIIFFTLRKFIHSFKHNLVFTIENIRRLQRIGMLILLIDPLRWVSNFIKTQWIEHYFEALQSTESIVYTLSYKVGYALGSGGFILHWTLTGLIILVIAQVFKQALALKEEQELTV